MIQDKQNIRRNCASFGVSILLASIVSQLVSANLAVFAGEWNAEIAQGVFGPLLPPVLPPDPPVNPPVNQQIDPPIDPLIDPIPPPPPPFSLKDVRQAVEIALPSEVGQAEIPQLEFDRMYPGVIGQSDVEVNGRRVDFYQFEGREDQQVVVVLRNSDDDRPTSRLPLSPYMQVFDPSGRVMAGVLIPGQHRIVTRDSLLPLDNQLALRLPQSGRYIVAVYADPGQGGRYGIGWKSDAATYRYDQMHEFRDVNLTASADVTNIASENVEIPAKTGQIVRIEAMSYEFDPYLALVDANGTVIAENDDDGGNYNARLNVTIPQDGIYRVRVTSANGGQGQYRLTVR